MAEVALISLASKICDDLRSIWGAEKEIDELQQTFQTIQGVLLDAVKNKVDSAQFKDWIVRLEGLMYDAEDLIDLVAIDDLRKQQMKENKYLRAVRVFFSKFNPVISRNNVAKKVKAIRKSLDDLCKGMAHSDFRPSANVNLMSGSNQRKNSGSFLEPEVVIGRDADKNAILEFLSDKSSAGQSVSVTAIVGIGSIGKTTLAKLVYHDESVCKNFERRSWATISGISDEKQILARILESISMNESCHSFTISEMHSAIVESIDTTGKYLLVLDDVRDCAASLWFNIMSLLRSATTGSRIIITSKSLEVAKDVRADQIHELKCLTEEESWQLFEMIALQPEQEYTPDQISLGRDIVGRCNGVPLAIKCIASLLSIESTIQEWQFFANEKRLFDGNDVMSVIKLSYDHLPTTLKVCLAYCSLFPEDYVFQKEKLICLWIAQGYVRPTSDGRFLEEIGYEYLMELFKRFFFQDATVDECGEVLCWKMHGSVYDFVQRVAGDESLILTERYDQNQKNIRHISVDYEIDSSWNIPPSLFHMDQPALRSFLFLSEGSLSPPVHGELLKCKPLRALILRHQKIENVPSTIRELKHLRYLCLSHNKFIHLPDSITTLVHLLTLDISWCEQLVLLPNNFRKLCSLRHLDNRKCYRLRHMPPGFEELKSLQYLSFFKVGRKVMHASSSRLNVLAKLKLKGELEIKFDEDMDWDENECLQLPIGIRVVTMRNYPGMRLTAASLLPNLMSLCIGPSSKIEHLPLFRGLPFLRTLQLSYMDQLEYIEIQEDEIQGGQSGSVTTDNELFFPRLKVLILEVLPKLKGWSREVEAAFTRLPVLADVKVRCCQELKFMPLCPHLQTLELNDVNDKLIQHLLSTSFNASSSSAPFSSLQTIAIWGCDFLSFPGETLTSLHHLEVRFCDELKSLYLAPVEVNTLEELVIQGCPELELWEEEKRVVDWDSLPELRKLTVIGMPNPDKLPDCLRQCQADGKLLINME